MNRVTPGIRFFQCTDCGSHWETPTSDIRYSSGEKCPNQMCINNSYNMLSQPYQIQERPEWPSESQHNPNHINTRIRY